MLSAANTLITPESDTTEHKSILFNSTKNLIIGIVGASGKIGTKVLETMWGNPDKFPNIGSIVALNTLPRVNFGMFLDFSVAFPQKTFGHTKKCAVETVLTNDPAKLKNADVIFITAGLWPDKAMRVEWLKKDETGRLVQSSVNFQLIVKICGDIKKYAPNAIVYIMTNQVDMMTELARKELSAHKVIGIGGHIDSMRYKFVLANLLFQFGRINTNDPDRITAHIIGFHNKDMLLLKDSLRIDGHIPDWEDSTFSTAVDKAIEATRSFGKMVSDYQSHPKRPGIDSGSSIAPAKAITDVVQAMCTGRPLIASFNTVVNGNVALQYGIEDNTALSIPIIIQGMDIRHVSNPAFTISTIEKEKLRLAQQKLSEDTSSLFALQVGQPALPDSLQAGHVAITVNSLGVPVLPFLSSKL